MTRSITVLLVAALCAATLGMREPSWAAQDDTGREAARQQAVSTRVGKIRVGSVVKIERSDGRKIEGVLTAKTPDSITVNVYQRRAFRRPRLVRADTIPLNEVKEIKKPLTGKQQAAIAAGVVAGTCAVLTVAVASSLDVKSPRAVSSTGDTAAPVASGTTEPSATEQGASITTP